MLDNIQQANNGDKQFVSLNPANQETVWQGEYADEINVDEAIKTARKAYVFWSQLKLEQRQEYIKKFIEILSINKDKYAQTISQEMGKPLWEAKTEVSAMIGKYDLSVKSYHDRTGYIINNNSNIGSILIHKPIGVMVVFGPFNFPGHLPNGHILPALLAGNTVVFKPSEQTPLCGEWMIKYWLEAGLPEGVLNLVQGAAETGKALVNHPDINGVLFTGSYTVGKMIHQQLAGRPEVILALEMGGNNALIIDDSITSNYEINAAVYNTIQSAFITSGQRCTCARRLYIPNSKTGKLFLDKLVEITSKLILTGSEPFMGPVVSLTAANNILKFKNNLINNSENNITELSELKLMADNSALLAPGILLYKNNNLDILDAECFGPLLQVFYYTNFDEAIIAANNTKYGLAAGLLSNNKQNIDKFHNVIKAGIVNWNRPTTGAAGGLPFGGIGHSGNYRPSAAYAADYCSYPMASQYSENLELPEQLSPGIVL
ncbi:MAG: succinylglutamate-semialdehyde dehydrogenase [Gammaproteobacteria bacterium]|nr:succinylglutamate-semialdehyde dehydrogenase [Gammaproteobacteria bacterium]